MPESLIDKVKELREETGISIMECKKALEEVDGDLGKAKDILAEKGLEEAEEKQGDETCHGFVATYTHTTGKVGAMVKLESETDFTARNPEFRTLARDICLQVASMNPKDKEDLLSQNYIRETDKTIEEVIKTNIAKFGENIKIGDFARFEI
jgi:elongation factor Ts